MSNATEAYDRLRDLKFIPKYACDLIAQLFFSESPLAVPTADCPVPEDQKVPSPDTDVSVQRGNYCILDLDTSQFHCFNVDDSAFADALLAPSLCTPACCSYPDPSSAFAHTINNGSLERPAVIPPSLPFKLPSLLPFAACLSTVTQVPSKALAVPPHTASTRSRKRKLVPKTSVEHRIAILERSRITPEELQKGAALRDNVGVPTTHIDDLMTNEELSEFIEFEQGHPFVSANSNPDPGTSVHSSAAVHPKIELPTDDESCYILRGRNVRRFVPDMPKKRRSKDRRAKGFWGMCSTMGFNARIRSCSGRVTVVLKGTFPGARQYYACSQCGHSRLRYRL